VVDEFAEHKLVFDATPDFPAQLQMLEAAAPDDSFDLSIFLTHGHIGHYTGLMHLGREAQGSDAVPVFAAPRMRQFLTAHGPWSQLVELGNIKLQPAPLDEAQQVTDNLTVRALTVPHRDEFTETLAFIISGPHHSALYLPDIDKWERWSIDIRDLLDDVDYAFLDATFYAADELPGRDMSEIPHPFVAESTDHFADLDEATKAKIWFIHFNHTNPLLIDGSPAQRQVEKLGFNVARQGMRFHM